MITLPHQRMQHAEFQDALRLRLLISPWNARPGGFITHCACDPTVDAGAPGLVHHAMTCSRLQGTRTHRHHAVRDALARLLRSLPETSTVSVEEQVKAEIPGARDMRIDILLRIARCPYLFH